ncbi:MAG TPA: MFS transporter [Geobacteraceae bacterium]|nr:MFS transporter [Geobacteraceae bacterium]
MHRDSPGFNRSFISFIAARAAGTVAFQMAGVAVGWHVYNLTGKAFDLGLVGLAQFLPSVVLVLFVGHAADRYNRRHIVAAAQLAMALILGLLALGSFGAWITRDVILGLLVLIGIARAFEFTTLQTLLPSLVDQETLPRALAVAGSVRQAAVITGPLLGGFLYIAGATAVYLTTAVLFVISAAIVLSLAIARRTASREPPSLASFFAGIAFIRSKPVVFGAISLDLFAVLLGGATALLPIYARDILHTGPWGLGLLRAAPAVGALVVSLAMVRFPLRRRVGGTMFACVALFGLATIAFALSPWLPFSCLLLAVLGGADMVSVVIRSTLVQLETPDEMRGRVSAVNAIFIGSSNELGEFESGLTAAWFGVVPATLIGGIGTLLVVLLWARLFPTLLRHDRLRSEQG